MGFPVGSVILLYNNEGSNNCYNFVANETGAGGQFFIPVGTSTLMESTSDSPTVQGTPACDYCGATYTTPGTWGPIGLGNTADGLQVRCPGCSDEEPAMFQAISYGTGFGTVAMGTNDLGGMFSSGTGTQQTYSYTFSTCITSGTPGTWTRTTAAGAGTPPATAGVVDAGVRTQLESCSIPCCGGFEEQPDEEAVAANGRYRFGFQGQEKDDEMHGATGTSYAFEYRIHDPRVGRFLSIDPLAATFPWNTPYSFSENRVIDCIELEGLEVVWAAGRLADANGSTLMAIADNTTLMAQGREVFGMQNRLNAVIVNGTPVSDHGRPNGENFTIPFEWIKEYVEAPAEHKQSTSFAANMENYGVDYGTDEFQGIVQTTYEMNNDLNVSVIKNSDLDAASGIVAPGSGKFPSIERILHRGPTALTVVHEFVIHGVSDALGVALPEEQIHGIFFAPRDENGIRVPGQTGGAYKQWSPGYQAIDPSSTMGKAKQEIETRSHLKIVCA